MSQTEKRIAVSGTEEVPTLFGRNDVNLNIIEQAFPVKVTLRGGELVVTGDEVEVGMTERLLGQLLGLVRAGNTLSEREVRYATRIIKEGKVIDLAEVFSDAVVTTTRGKPIKAKTLGQKRYIDAIRNSTLTFGLGPAGTGKTYLAMAMAIAAFKNRSVNRIVLTRPAVEAGEKLGFLPGDLKEKVDPYLRPLYDALFDILGVESFDRYTEKGQIEIAPLAYMRGRTLDDSFIILDEAQNTTPEQMKMFLTRLGFGSKVVVTGDPTQKDLPPGQASGLAHAAKILDGVEGVSICQFNETDVVRHELVQRIIKAYERSEAQT